MYSSCLREISSIVVDPDFCRNAIEYTYNYRYKDAVEITLHFINIKEMKFSYKQNGNKLSGALVAYLLEDRWWPRAFELCYNEAQRPIYYLETMENPKHPKP